MLWVIFVSMLVLPFTHFLAWSIGHHKGYGQGYDAAAWLSDQEMEAAVSRWSGKIQRIRSLYTLESAPEMNTNNQSSQTSSPIGSLGDRIMEVQRLSEWTIKSDGSTSRPVESASHGEEEKEE